MSQRPARSIRTRSLLAVILAVAAALAPAAAAQASEGGPNLTVMTRNLYLGTGLDNTVFAESLPDLVSAVSTDWANVLATDFPTRARALADEIVGAHADVVGLQEVTLWRDQTPSDVLVHPAPNATHVVFDFLAILQAQLAARGSPYTAVSTSTNADAEAPRQGPNGLIDLRITDRDVILVRTPLAGRFSNPQHGLYATQLSLTVPATGRAVTFTRGWAAVDYRHDARTTVRILDTHLEVPVPAPPYLQPQLAQGAEFLGVVAASPYPVIALGDFNSAADGSGTLTYGLLTTVLRDAWAGARPTDPGLSCCQNELLSNAASIADSRIDLVLTTRNWPADRVALTGNTPFEASAPRWASDHFGVTARIELQR